MVWCSGVMSTYGVLLWHKQALGALDVCSSALLICSYLYLYAANCFVRFVVCANLNLGVKPSQTNFSYSFQFGGFLANYGLPHNPGVGVGSMREGAMKGAVGAWTMFPTPSSLNSVNLRHPVLTETTSKWCDIWIESCVQFKYICKTPKQQYWHLLTYGKQQSFPI